jgi:hypothetical protein
LQSNQLFGRADRLRQILVGGLALLAAAFFGYFGIVGLAAYLNGSRAAPAEPLGWAIGIPTSIWAAYIGLRILLRRQSEKALLPTWLIVIASLAAIAAGVVLAFEGDFVRSGRDLRGLTGIVVVGITGLWFTGRRWRASRSRVLPNEEL